MAKGEHFSEGNNADLDQYTKDALDEIFSKEQQSYDDFLERFMFLKKEVMTGVKSPGSYNKGTIHTAIQCPPKKTEPTDREDSVPEEVLDPGFRTPSIILRSVKSSCQPVPQVDNFVDHEYGMSDSEDGAEDHSDNNTRSSHMVDHLNPSASCSPSLAVSLRTSKMSLGSQYPSDLYDHLSRRGEDLTFAESIQDYKSGVSDKHVCAGVTNIPGEIEDLEISIQGDICNMVAPNVRQLEISTKLKEYKQADIKEHNNEMDNEETCEVEPFTLDADFDYDNVTLTPKFDFLTGRI